ncbi:unnamed protein product [Ceutorhynchus assimilis]|uniref:Corticotropin-releasing factor-binding protein n=1 Tax=Ceutorhynchus assimilis TaxID=467358 RepID=A0A9N9QCY7_9CUCU|nr:unnamed protein product [Ceutorhynchus assimilis]
MTFVGFQTFFSLAVLAIAAQGRPEDFNLRLNPFRTLTGFSFRPSSKLRLNQEIDGDMLSSPARLKRDPEHHIEECMHMASDEGEYYYKAKLQPDGRACGIYIFGESDQQIEIRFNFIDVACENGGLVAVVDGWELNGEVFPSPEDHPKALKSRFNEFCGKRKIKQTFVSSQNVALIQYRMPARGASFSFSVRLIRNPSPCNVLLQVDDTYTLRNYDRRSNCSITSLFPAAIKVLDINVGITPTRDRGVEYETGTYHKCQKRGLDDYVQIGGSLGLDNGNMEIADSLCGLSSKPERHPDFIGCETTSARLVSSGAYENSVTVLFRKLTENDMNAYMSVVCIPDEVIMEK